MTITLRSTKGSPLTHDELDGNFTDLNSNKASLASLAASGGSALVGFLPSGTGGVSETVSTALQRFVFADQYGAVGDGVTDDYTNFIKAYTATATGGTLYIPPKTFYLAGAASTWTIAKSIKVVFAAGAKLLFDHHTTTNYYVNITGSDVIIEDFNMDGQGSSRVTSAGILVSGGAARVWLVRPRIVNSSGSGITVNNASEVRVDQPYVKSSFADGIHITNDSGGGGHVTKHVTVTSPYCESTGDDSVSVVSYAAEATPVTDVTITGAIAVSSTTAGFACSGGQRVRYDGIAISCGSTASTSSVRVEQDSTNLTGNCYDVTVKAFIYNATGIGLKVGKLVFDSDFEVMVDTTTVRGVSFGSGASSNLAERNILKAKVYNCTSTGIDINGVKGLTSPYLSASGGAGVGVALSANNSQIAIGTIFTKNNATGGSANNISFLSATDVSVGSVTSIDDNNNINRTMEINGCSRVSVGAFSGYKNGAVTNAVETGTCSNIWLGGRIPDLGSLVSTASVSNSGTGVTNLQSQTMGVNWLNTAKQRIRIRAWGTYTNSANAKTVILLLGGTTLYTASLTTGQSGAWQFEANVVASAASAQNWSVRFYQSGTTQQNDLSTGTATETTTANITVKCTGQGGASTEITQLGLEVEPANN